MSTTRVCIAKNEPSAALHVLARQGRVGHLGAQPNRRYYLPIDMPEVPAAVAKAKAALGVELKASYYQQAVRNMQAMSSQGSLFGAIEAEQAAASQ